jgi:hypothetical protein
MSPSRLAKAARQRVPRSSHDDERPVADEYRHAPAILVVIGVRPHVTPSNALVSAIVSTSVRIENSLLKD